MGERGRRHTSDNLLDLVQDQVHERIVALEGTGALAAAIELYGDALVHVLAEVEDVLLLGALAALAVLVVSVAGVMSSTATASSSVATSTAPVATATSSASTAATAALVGCVGHGGVSELWLVPLRVTRRGCAHACAGEKGDRNGAGRDKGSGRCRETLDPRAWYAAGCDGWLVSGYP